MRTNKGQALLEFVLILPLLLLFLFTIIDVGRIIYEQNRLEGIINDVIDLISKGNISDQEIENIIEDDYDIDVTLIINRNINDINIKLSRTIDIITPGLEIAISDPYVVEVKRVIHNE